MTGSITRLIFSSIFAEEVTWAQDAFFSDFFEKCADILSRKKMDDWSIKRSNSLFEKSCEAKTFDIFRALTFNGWSKTLEKGGYDWETAVGTQSESILSESVETRRSYVLFRGISEFFGDE